MHSLTPCGCKGARSCILCSIDKVNHLNSKNFATDENTFIYCPFCHLAHNFHCVIDADWCESNELVTTLCRIYIRSETFNRCILECLEEHLAKKTSERLTVCGIFVFCSFMDPKYEAKIIEEIECFQWKASQSGRLKQDFGPKPNFKKKKLRLESFTGLPSFSEKLLPKLKVEANGVLDDFEAVEQCHLDYDPIRGSHIDMHYDDFWLWGDRLVTVNLLSDSIISLTHPQLPYTVLIGQPRYSVVVLSSEARNEWLHGIYPNHIIDRRVAITYRELTKEMKSTEVGRKVTEIASNFGAVQTSS
ncbi:alpha-ketoglutarate-dependent dioxygenase alkB homolog 4-like [Convolutriloba macropyga]|uniref:alpha-ketoglutarate-dependent dioxygenase alkB homolog 4-like n=1 Tax=Convolutriloba macropyga TaxID=536237 RepID=UPI003F522D10